MITKFHPSLTEDKWGQSDKVKQLLNVAAEFSRARNCLRIDDQNGFQNSLDRAFELIDLTIADPKWRRGLKELLRFREQLAALYIQDKHDINYFNLLLRAWLNFNGETARVEI